MNAFKFGTWMQKVADTSAMNAINAQRVAQMKSMAGGGVPNMYDNMKATRQLQPGQKFRGGQLVSGPGAQPLTAAQQDEVNAANDMKSQFDAIGAGSGGLGRAGMGAASQQASKSFNAINAGLVGSGRGGILNQVVQSLPPSPPPSPPVQTQPNPPVSVQQPQTQSAQPAAQPTMWQRFRSMMPGSTSASSWANQTNSPQAGPLSAPLSNVSNSFNNATGQQDPPHIITTDNGRKFNTQTKQFLDGRPGGF